MKIHIITNCSSTRLVEPIVRVQDMPSNLNNAEAIDWWVSHLNACKVHTTPREQYRGIGFTTLLRTLNTYEDIIKSVHIVTGGLGFTDLDETIVPYDFSGSSKEEHNITQKVTREPFNLGVWWSMINKARHPESGGYPVAQFINELGDDEVCVIACSKLFLKYIAQDFLHASEEAKGKVRILLTASSIGSVPMQLRPNIVSFERAAIQHIPGNRNDIQHRALYQFISNVKTLEEFTKPSWELSQQVFGSPLQGTSHGFDILDMIKSRPQLLQFDADTAYKALYREVGPFGGRQNFKGIFLQHKISEGLIDLGEGDEIEADDDALDALKGLSLTTASAPAGSHEDTQTSDLIKTFASAVRKANPTAEFAAADVCAWAKSYTDKKGIELPDTLSSPIKLVYYLKSYAPLFGMEKLDKTFKLQVSEEVE